MGSQKLIWFSKTDGLKIPEISHREATNPPFF